jgi:alanine racemase
VTSRLTVDLGALSDNYAVLRGAAAPSTCGAVVKADGYGLGAVAVATRLAALGCGSFFVATPAEGIALRDALATERIYVLCGVDAAEAPGVADRDLVPVINCVEQLDAWRPYRSKPIAVHVDSGMHRLGFAPSEATAERFAGFDIALLMTHLACADEPDSPRNALQLARFDAVRQRFQGVATSIGNSAGTLLSDAYRGDLCRPGIALYGGNPFLDAPNTLRAVATFEARILQLRSVPPNEPVGYGATGAVDAQRLIAVLGAGYADGIPRALSGCGAAAVSGTRVPIVGRISMDLTAIDVTQLADRLAVGDWVELIGARVGVDDVAAIAGTNAYEILTGLGRRSERRYVG